MGVKLNGAKGSASMRAALTIMGWLCHDRGAKPGRAVEVGLGPGVYDGVGMGVLVWMGSVGRVVIRLAVSVTLGRVAVIVGDGASQDERKVKVMIQTSTKTKMLMLGYL